MIPKHSMSSVVKHFIGRNTFTSDLDGDVSVDSDCEGDLQGLGEENQRAKEENEEPVRALFITGSFSAYVAFHLAFFLKRDDRLSSWKSLFFYCCTDEILFAPLKSQGVDSRLKYIRENTVEVAPPPCSPKSIYVLANLVRLSSTKHLTHDTNVTTIAGNQAPPRQCPSGGQKPGNFPPRRTRGLLVGNRRVRAILRFQTRMLASY